MREKKTTSASTNFRTRLCHQMTHFHRPGDWNWKTKKEFATIAHWEPIWWAERVRLLLHTMTTAKAHIVYQNGFSTSTWHKFDRFFFWSPKWCSCCCWCFLLLSLLMKFSINLCDKYFIHSNYLSLDSQRRIMNENAVDLFVALSVFFATRFLFSFVFVLLSSS